VPPCVVVFVACCGGAGESLWGVLRLGVPQQAWGVCIVGCHAVQEAEAHLKRATLFFKLLLYLLYLLNVC
jgi:hypothetical protein